MFTAFTQYIWEFDRNFRLTSKYETPGISVQYTMYTIPIL